jgi:hypothetical protein
VDTCHTVTIDGDTIHVRSAGPLGPVGEMALAEVIRAAKRKYAETASPDIQDGSRLRVHQERIRARLAALRGHDGQASNRTETGANTETSQVNCFALTDNTSNASFTVYRTDPVEQLAAEPGTLDRLKRQLFAVPAERLGIPTGQIGEYGGFPLHTDPDLPPNEIHFRPHPWSADNPSATP